MPSKESAGLLLRRARLDYGPTEGCVALALTDLLEVSKDGGATTRLCVEPG